MAMSSQAALQIVPLTAKSTSSWANGKRARCRSTIAAAAGSRSELVRNASRLSHADAIPRVVMYVVCLQVKMYENERMQALALQP